VEVQGSSSRMRAIKECGKAHTKEYSVRYADKQSEEQLKVLLSKSRHKDFTASVIGANRYTVL
jgi:hypothetical protein